MNFDYFVFATILFVILTLYFLLVSLNSIRRIKNSLKKALKDLNREWKIQGNSIFFMQPGYQVFKNKKLKLIWETYLNSFFVEKGVPQYANINEYFSGDKTLDEITNTRLANFFPIILFVVGAMIDGLVYLFYQYTSTITDKLQYESIALMFVIVIISMLLYLYTNSLIFRTRSQFRKFSKWISLENAEMPTLSEQLGDLRFTMHSYQHEQLKFYAKLTDHIEQTTTKAIQPFLDGTTTTIENFVSATTNRHVESMQHLAEYFVTNSTQLYLDQIDRLSETTSNMSEIQAKTAETLSFVTTIYTESKECIEIISNTSANTLTTYEEYLTNVKAINNTLSDSVKSLEDLVEYISINSRNQIFTIDNITKFQEDLIDVSKRSTDEMKIFFDEFKDQYSSSLIALRAASGDIAKAGELLKGSYTQMADNIEIDINKVFKTFEENLATISIHLSQSINDLQEAIDELPEILKPINNIERASDNES